MKSRTFRFVLAFVIIAALVSTTFAVAAARHHPGGPGGSSAGRQFFARLTSYQEVPSLNSMGQATLRLTVTASQMSFDLTFSGLSGPPSMAHVHVGQPGVSGGVSFFLCGGGSKPACPTSTSGEVTGTVSASDIQAIAAQGFDAGDFDSVVRAMDAGATYANMHTAKFPAGEVRGQLLGGHDFDPGHDH